MNPDVVATPNLRPSIGLLKLVLIRDESRTLGFGTQDQGTLAENGNVPERREAEVKWLDCSGNAINLEPRVVTSRTDRVTARKRIKYPVDAFFIPVFCAREGEGEGKI